MDYELIISNAIAHFADEWRVVGLPDGWYSSGFGSVNGSGVYLTNHKLNKNYYIHLDLKYDDFYKRYYCEIRTEGREFYNNFIFDLYKNNTQKKLIEFIYNEIECIIYNLKNVKTVKYEQLTLF